MLEKLVHTQQGKIKSTDPWAIGTKHKYIRGSNGGHDLLIPDHNVVEITGVLTDTIVYYRNKDVEKQAIFKSWLVEETVK